MLDELLGSLPQVGRVEWIGVRPARAVPMQSVGEAEIRIGEGMTGDRFRGRPDSKRQVTFIQSEHLDVVGAVLGRDRVDPILLRRNIVVAGINLQALKHARFAIGDLLFEGTGDCHPCSQMEKALGAGGYNAMRGHGGITTRVITGGVVRVGDEVQMVEAERVKKAERGAAG